MASWRRLGATLAGGSRTASAASTRPATSRDQSWKSEAITTRRASPESPILVGREVAQRFAVEDRDASLRVREARLAELDQLGAPLVSGERFLEGQLAVFHARDERIELFQRLLER